MATTTDPAAGSGTRTDKGIADTFLPADAHRDEPRFPLRTIVMGLVGSVLVLIASFGAAGVLVHDPILSDGPLAWVRFGHGKVLMTGLLYLGFGLVVWAWIRLGRYVLAGRVGTRPVVIAALSWMAPLMVAPPLFTRDVYSYLGQGAQLLHGLDPYAYGPRALETLPMVVENVHPLWQTTPAPYGPLFLWISQSVVGVTGDNVIAGVIVMRVVLLAGLAALLWALPRLVRKLGGNLPVTMWLAVASPMMVIHLVGGPHNDLLMVGLLAVGVLAALERKHVTSIVLVTIGMLIKPTAAIALPFLVWIWANHMPADKSLFRRFVSAVTPSLGIFGAVFVAGTWVSLGSFNLGWVGGLSAPQIIVNWLNFPSGVGEAVHTLFKTVVDVPPGPFIDVARSIGWLVLAAIVVRQWWLARNGDENNTIFRMGVALLTVAIFAPPTLPWYLTWGFVILSLFRWKREHLAAVVGISVFLVLVYYPTGEQSLYHWLFIIGVVAASLYAAASLLRPDPLGLVSAWRKEDPRSRDVRNPELPLSSPTSRARR